MFARSLLAAALIATAPAALAADMNWPNYQEADFVAKNYAFKSGESLPEVKIHYRTLGTIKHDGNGDIANAVLLLQGNTGTSTNWLRPSLADASPPTGCAPNSRITATTTWSICSTGW